MPDLKELLHAGAPQGAPLDIDRLRGRARRRRTGQRVATTLGVLSLVVAAAVAVGASGPLRRHAAPVATAHRATAPSTAALGRSPAQLARVGITLTDVFGAHAVAVGPHGDVWVGSSLPLVPSSPQHPTRGTVGIVSQVLANGQLMGRVTSAGITHLAVGGGRVWAAGPSVGGKSGVVEAIDETTGEMLGIASVPAPFEPLGLVVRGDDALLTDRAGSAVLRARFAAVPAMLGPKGAPTGTVSVSTVVTAGDPTDIVATRAGDIWVKDSDAIARLDLTGAALVDRHPWSGRLLATDAVAGSTAGAVLATDGRGRLVELTPARLASGQSVALGQRLPLASGGVVAAAAGPTAIWWAGAGQVFRSAAAGDPAVVQMVMLRGVTAMAAAGPAAWLVLPTGQLAKWVPRAH